MFSEAKMKELIVYVAKRSANDPRLGRTKLAKLLFLADFEAYGELGESITGACYLKRPYGPLPAEELLASKELASNDEIEIKEVDFYGYRQKHVVAKREPDLRLFEPSELAIVDAMIDRHWEDSATYLSDLSHAHPGWKFCAYGEQIPYNSVFWPREVPNQRDVDRALELLAEIETSDEAVPF